MKTIRHGRNARDPLLHIEADGVLVNIRVGLTDTEGHHVTRIDISPDDTSRGGDGEGYSWHQDGPRIIRLPPGEEPPAPKLEQVWVLAVLDVPSAHALGNWNISLHPDYADGLNALRENYALGDDVSDEHLFDHLDAQGLVVILTERSYARP